MEQERKVKSMSELIQERTPAVAKDKGPRHEKAASVDEILKVVGKSEKYGYTYWLRKIGRCSYPEVLGILKQVEGADKKYNKGGMITNLLDKHNGKKRNKNSD